MRAVFQLFTPHEQTVVRTARGQGIERRLMRSFIKELRERFFLWAAHIDGFAVYDLRHIRGGVVHVANQNRLGRTNDDASWFEPDVNAVGAEVTFFRRVIFRIDEDGVVRTSGHACFAANTNRLIKIDDAVRAFEHGRRRARGDTRGVGALIAARHLVRAARLGKDADVNVLYISARDADGNNVFRLAGSRAGMTTDATGVVDDLGPLNLLRLKHGFD